MKTTLTELDFFTQVAQNQFIYLEDWKKNHPGQQAVGYFCSYGPEELIWALGMLPFRIFVPSEELELADQHLQAYSCSVIRQGLELGLSGQLQHLDFILFVQTCDSMQRLSDIFRLNINHPKHLDLILPAVLNKPSALSFYQHNLKSMALALRPTGELPLEQAQKSCELFNQIRELITRIKTIHLLHPQLISAKDVFHIQKAAQFMDRIELLNSLKSLDHKLQATIGDKNPNTEPRSYKRILLSGSVCNFSQLYPLLEQNKAVVVFSDLCTGDRYFAGKIAPISQISSAGQWPASFFQVLVQRYAQRINCPAKHQGLKSRGQYLQKLAHEQAVDGIIFLTLKFCDPHAFDLPYLREHLASTDIACLFYEIEELDFPSEQFTTRCQAFLEML